MSKKNTTDPNAPDFDLDSFLNPSAGQEKLDDKQFEKLEIFLEGHPNGMHMEILDGFFCGLICGPDADGPEAFIPYIFGGQEPEYASPAQAEEIQGSLRQHWDYIKGMMESGESYYPFLYSDNNFKVSGNDWALGFVLAVDKYRESWDALLQRAQEEENLLTPILTLYLENSPENTEGLIHAEDREEIVKTLIENLPKIYRHFHEGNPAGNPNTLH